MADYRDGASGLTRWERTRGRRDIAAQDLAVREPEPAYDDAAMDAADGHGALVPGRAPRSPRAALEPERVPVPTKWSETVRHPLIIAGNAIFTVLILLALVGGGLYVFARQSFEASGPLEADKVVNIPPRSGIRDISDILVREGVIDRPWTFVAVATVAQSSHDMKFGEYQFTRQSSLRDVINTLTDGKVVQHQFTIPEGLTSQQIVERLAAMDILSGNIREIPGEGTLLPESYRYPRGASREQVIQRMKQAQAALVREVWEKRMPDLPLRSPEELVTLASIVEKETGRGDERSRVAAVFVNRLKQKMKLQSDPTIIYGLVGGKGSLGRPIMKSEIEKPTSYNTYTIQGLPPGPIANPGRAALEATANPARTKELYFVADGTGGHTFSETLEQHTKAVARLRAIEQGQREESAPTSGSGGRAATARPSAPR
jgi:UPF0755 protein